MSYNLCFSISVALCRLFFRIHKAHDAMLFMTILGTDSDELQRLLGYNGTTYASHFSFGCLPDLQMRWWTHQWVRL